MKLMERWSNLLHLLFRRGNTKNFMGIYCRLTDGTSETIKEDMFFSKKNYYIVSEEKFSILEERPIAYWLSDSMFEVFKSKSLGKYAKPRQGMATSDNNRFLRLWHEIGWKKICFNAANENEAIESRAKWFPYNKGGGYRKWYGNNEYLINWENNGEEVKNLAISLYKCSSRTIKNTQFYFQKGITWSTLASGRFGARYSTEGFLFDTKGSTCYFDNGDYISYIAAFLNSSVANELLKVLAPTLDYNAGSIAKLPLIINRNFQNYIEEYYNNCVDLSKHDWDSFENSWDFQQHPLVTLRAKSKERTNLEEWQYRIEDTFFGGIMSVKYDFQN